MLNILKLFNYYKCFLIKIQVIKNRYSFNPLTDQIGKGTYGQVYKALDLNNKQIVAVKMVDADGISDSKAEAEFIEQLDCPYLVRGIEHFFYDQSTTKKLVIVMPFYSLKDIKAFVKEYYNNNMHEVEDDLILKWCIQTLLAIQYLHELQTIHRDIKLANFFLDNKANVHLGDLGCSTQKTLTKTMLGTPETLAPEIISQVPYTSCVWFELITGEKPFYDQTHDTRAEQIYIKAANYQYNKQAQPRNQRLYDICLKMISNVPDQRPSADQIVQQIPDLIQQLDQLQEIQLSDKLKETISQSLQVHQQIQREMEGTDIKNIIQKFKKQFQEVESDTIDCTYDPLAFLQQEYNVISCEFPSMQIQQARSQAIKEMYFN